MEKSYHFIGIGGIGMSALAFLLLKQGCAVSGSDLYSSRLLQDLEKQGAKIFLGHKKNRIKKNMTVVYSSAVQKNNPELVEAKKRQLKILHRSELLEELIRQKKALLVAGTHGKTTTSSLLSWVLEQSGQDPSYAVGGLFNQKNARWGQGEYFVAEADESDGSFLHYQGTGAIITNVENDHLEYWQTVGLLKKGFQMFIEQIKETDKLFLCLEDPFLKKMAVKYPCISYGFQKADLRAREIETLPLSMRYTIEFQGKRYEKIELNLMGKHNVLNSLSVFGMALSLGLDVELIKKAFKTFPGVERRLQKIAEKNQILFLEDYGHHPTEIKTVLKALKTVSLNRKAAGKKSKIICVFQPHRYSRTFNLFSEFTEAFKGVDELIITDIYSAFEKKLKVNSKMLAEAIAKKQKKVFYVAEKKMFSFLQQRLQENQIVLFLGAGNISQMGRDFVGQL